MGEIINFVGLTFRLILNVKLRQSDIVDNVDIDINDTDKKCTHDSLTTAVAMAPVIISPPDTVSLSGGIAFSFARIFS